MEFVLNVLGEFIWIIPLAIIQISLMGLGIWQWLKHHQYLGFYKVFWLFIILFLNFFGPILFFVYLRSLEWNKEGINVLS